MSLDLDLSLETLIAWKRKPHATVEDLFGVKRTPWQHEARSVHAHPTWPAASRKAPPERVPRQTFAALTRVGGEPWPRGVNLAEGPLGSAETLR
jgi:hypothetical protein